MLATLNRRLGVSKGTAENMKNSNANQRNSQRASSARELERPSRKSPQPHVGSPTTGASRNPARLFAVGKSTLLAKRSQGQQVDAVFGVGREDMSTEYVARSLARIVRKGVRSATVREIAGASVIFSSEIPAGMFALRTADRITAYRSETRVPVVEVLCGTAGIAI